MKKSKLFVALLTSLCISAGAIGMTACGNGDDEKDKDDTQNEQDGSDILDEDVESKENITIAGKAYILYTLKDGKKISKPADGVGKTYEGTVFSLQVTDNDGRPVPNVRISIIYEKNYVPYFVATAKTDADGGIVFNFEPENGIQYKLILGVMGNDDAPAPDLPAGETFVPAGYSDVLYNGEWEPVYSVNIAAFEDVALKVKISNGFNSSDVKAIVYERYYNASQLKQQNPGAPQEKNEGLTTSVQAGKYVYMSFSPYVFPGTDDDPVVNALVQKNADAAANGVYEISFTADKSGVVLYNWEGNLNNMPTDEDGVPSQIISSTDNSAKPITITVNNENTSQIFVLGVHAENDCTVTISVKRTGDAENITYTTVMKTAEDISRYENWESDPDLKTGSSADLTLMPINGAVNAVYNNSDKFYHVGSVTGPLLYVNLTKEISRFGVPIADIIEDKENGGSVQFTVTTGEFERTVYDYGDFLKAYAAICNRDDGVCPVNEELKEFLGFLSTRAISYLDAASECAWLIPCQYYSPANGLLLQGDGTESSPFKLIEGKSQVNMTNGSAYLSFTTTSASYFTFEAGGNAEIEVLTQSLQSTVINNLLYIYLDKGATLQIKLTGDESSYTFTVKAIADVIKATAGDSPEGVTSDKAVTVIGTGIRQVDINSDLGPDGVYVDFTAAPARESATCKYKFIVHGEFAKLIYNGQTYGDGDVLEIDVLEGGFDFTTGNPVQGDTYSFLLTSDNMQNCNFILEIIRVG